MLGHAFCIFCVFASLKFEDCGSKMFFLLVLGRNLVQITLFARLLALPFTSDVCFQLFLSNMCISKLKVALITEISVVLPPKGQIWTLRSKEYMSLGQVSEVFTELQDSFKGFCQLILNSTSTRLDRFTK